MCWFNNIPSHLPIATGTFVPGYMDVMVDYTRDGVFVRLYYPTDASKLNKENYKKWRCWISDNNYINGLANVLMIFAFIVRIVLWWTDYVHIPALYGAKAKTDSKLKCIIFSHGLGGSRFLYSNICCELASRGFLVVAVEHRDHSACNTYFYESPEDAELDHRTVIEFKHIPLNKTHSDSRQEQVQQRANECSKVLDFLINLNRNIVPHNILHNEQCDFNLRHLVAKLDLDTLTMMGHSFGGATSLLALSQRAELKLGVLLDPWMFPIKHDSLHKKISQPLLFINTQTFHIKANVKTMSKYLVNDDRQMYTILHTTHEHQTDSVLLIGAWLNLFMKKLSAQTALQINNALILKFLHSYLDYPMNSMDVQDCRDVIEKCKHYIVPGLTKPWA